MKTFLVTVSLALLLQDPIRVDVQLREMAVSVRDQAGRPVNGLQIQDFIVEEEDLAGKVAQLEAFRPPISFGILIDTRGRGGMDTTAARRRLEIEGVNAAYNAGVAGTKKLLAKMRPQDEIVLMTFTDSLKIDQDFTQNAEEARKRIQELRPSRLYGQALVPRETTLLSALDRAFEKMHKARFSKRVLIVHSAQFIYDINPVDILSVLTVPRGTKVYALGFDGRSIPGVNRVPESMATQGSPEKVFTAITSRSEGFSRMLGVMPPEEQATRGSAFMDTVLEDLAGEYIVRWYPMNPVGEAGGKIRVRTITPEYRVEVVAK